jgi:hypothetical protein
MGEPSLPHVTFRVDEHSHRSGTEVMEILIDGVAVATVSPGDGKSVRIISAHMKSVTEISGEGSLMPIPAVLIEFDPRPWSIEGGKLVRHGRH